MLTVPGYEAMLHEVPQHPQPSRFIAPGTDLRAAQMVEAIARLTGSSDLASRLAFEIIETSPAHDATNTTVVIIDGGIGSRRFKINLGGPDWAPHAGYTIVLGESASKSPSTVTDVANQLISTLLKRYDASLRDGTLPSPPPLVVLPDMARLLERLQDGPHFGDIVNARHAGSLPDDWSLSFGRVTPNPLRANAAELSELVVTGFSAFEQACNDLLDDPLVRDLILAGVDLRDPRMAACYTNPTGPFKIRRLDLVILEDGVVVSENDEMPGGLQDAYHHDWSYQINQDRWHTALDALTANGLLVFLVSSDWGEVYIRETQWFADHLSKQGYEVKMLSTAFAGQLEIRTDGVYLDDQPVGTIWRQFPIFEAEGHVADLVIAAQAGLVDMVPQFSSLGNKVWFSVFWSQRAYFERVLPPRIFELLSTCIPYTEVARSADDFPRRLLLPAGDFLEVESLEELAGLPPRYRNHIVLKVGGANERSARMKGVLLGGDTSSEVWRRTATDMFELGAPVIIQEFRSGREVTIPVHSVLDGSPTSELVGAKILGRPWSIGGELTSMTCFATPGTNRLHGTSHGCQVPADLH